MAARTMTAIRAPLQSVPIVTEPFRKIAFDKPGWKGNHQTVT